MLMWCCNTWAFVFDHLRRLLANAAARKQAASGDGRSGSAAAPRQMPLSLSEELIRGKRRRFGRWAGYLKLTKSPQNTWLK